MKTSAQAVFERISEAMAFPQFVRLEENLVMLAFRLMKLLPAKYVIEKAFREGLIDPKIGIVETSSGTYALGLGIVCAELGIPFRIVTDPAVDQNLKRRLIALGGEVHIVNAAAHAGNLQVQRMALLESIRNENQDVFWPCQYDNFDHRVAYEPLADRMIESFGLDFELIGTVGSGGSTCGLIQRLRRVNPDLKLTGVDTFGSVLFGLANGKRQLRGLGNSLFPKNLDQTLFDEIHWVGAADAFYHTRYLHGDRGLFYGPTSGAAFQVASWKARREPDRLFAFIAADEGYRYQETIYDNDWIREQGLWVGAPTHDPLYVETLGQVQPPWCWTTWGRQSLAAMTATMI